ncbi:MAG: hypothetical protein RIQ68_1552 [Pseudomonadota bacterium]|jgi:hypothetical protein
MTERPFRPHPKPEPRNKGETPTRQRPQPARVSPEKAGEIAILGLSWLAADPERLDKFLSLTGIDHGAIREAAQQAGFLGAVLEHLCADEESLLAFAAEANLVPEVISGAAVTLSGPAEWQSI